MTMKFTFPTISRLVAKLLLLIFSGCKKDDNPLMDEPVLEVIADNLLFAEGPEYLNGNLYFSDIQADRIYCWNKTGGLQVLMENSAGANGIYFASNGNMIVCQGEGKRIVSITAARMVTVITDKFGAYPYNEPNDLWVSPAGNIYFTDPVFTGTLSQPGQYVYCVQASSGQLIKVIDDLVKPNGIVGNSTGTLLYVADYGASKIYQYSIQANGTLSGKKLFAEAQADGLCTDSDGNIYAASNGIKVYNSSGLLQSTLLLPGTTTNICIVEESGRIAFITTHSTVYKYIIN
jgi:gluconolactonase